MLFTVVLAVAGCVMSEKHTHSDRVETAGKKFLKTVNAKSSVDLCLITGVSLGLR